MSIDNLNNNLSRKELNITTFSSKDTSSKDTFSLQDPTNLELVSRSSYNSSTGYGSIDTKEALETITGEEINDVPDSGGNNWGADLINAPIAWNEGYTGKGVVVAVLDGGVDYNHEDLRENIWTNSKEIAGNGKDDDGNGFIDDVYGWNFHDDNKDILDRDGHGTHVAGTIAGVNNDYGVTGIAYDAQIMPVKVLGDSGSGYYSSIVDGIYYAVDNGANVINLSLGGEFPSWDIDSAIEYAHKSGVTVIMAAGNSSGETPLYPASYADDHGIAVGAVDKNNEFADFSNRAGNDELAYVTAPGVNVYSTVVNNQYASYSGTSMAAPHVSGMVALMLSADPNLTPDQIREIVTQSATSDTQTTSSDRKILDLDLDLDYLSFAGKTFDSIDFNFNSVNFGANNSIDFAGNISSQAEISSIIGSLDLSTLSNLNIDFANNNNLDINPILSNPVITSELLNFYGGYLDVMTSIETMKEDYNAEELPSILDSWVKS